MYLFKKNQYIYKISRHIQTFIKLNHIYETVEEMNLLNFESNLESFFDSDSVFSPRQLSCNENYNT